MPFLYGIKGEIQRKRRLMVSAVNLGLTDISDRASRYDIIRLEVSVVISDPALGWLRSSLRKLNVIKVINSLNITFGSRPEYIYEYMSN
jgi:hypothetical protein